jgi:CRISPR system Cascade subunit CasB
MPPTNSRRYWSRYIDRDGNWLHHSKDKIPQRPPGEELAALRAGLGREVGDVPQMWPFYTSEPDAILALRNQFTTEQAAEHAALALFGLHQQSQDRPMHRPGVAVGRALLSLRLSEKFSEQAVDARVAAAASATTVPAFLMRLRGLVTQLRVIGQPLDYDQLLEDIHDWATPRTRQRARRRWALGYQAWGKEDPQPTNS